MQHMTIKAASATTDQGTFTAIAAAWSVDRERDQIQRGAFAKSIRSWQQSGKQLPLHWNHGGDASDLIGTVDPASMREAEEGLYVRGRLDLEESATAREAWRSMKANAVSLSFGYMPTKTRDRSDGVRELLEIDLFEISIVPHPANADTRFIDLKSAGNDHASDVADAEFELHRQATARADAAHERQRTDREVAELAAELEAKRAKEAKRNRPIRVKTFRID